MNRAAALFEKLNDADLDWLLSAGLEEQIFKDQAVIRAGHPVDALYLVVKGILGVFSSGLERERIAVVGPGGVVGEMSFLEECAPTESVVALETTTVLVLPFTDLEVKFQRDPGFAARLLRGMGKTLSQRLRRTNSRLVVEVKGSTTAQAGDNTASGHVGAAVLDLEGLIHQANEEALKNGDVVPPETADALVERFHAFYPLLEEAIGRESDEVDEVREQIGMHVRKQLLPYILLTRTAERMYAKPRGYPGDFMTLEMIHQNVPRGSSRIGAALDRCFLEAPFCAAIRERREALSAEIARLAAGRSAAEPLRVAALACGPAAEVFAAFERAPDPASIHATLIDFDPQALTFVGDRRERARLQDRIELVSINPVHLALGKARLDGEPRDVIVASGLIEQFDDATFVKLMDQIHANLRPGGRVLLAGFATGNPTRAFLEHVLDWIAAHRREEDLNRLLGESAFASPAVGARYGAGGVNLFAECVK